MKNSVKILSILAGAALVASCDLNKTPVWSDDDAFAAFDNSSMSVAESVGTLSIPVSVASIDPMAVSIAYKVVEDSTSTAAVQGVNYKLPDDGGVLVFDGEQRTAYIEIEVVDLAGTFTGDLSFSLELVSAGNLNLGSNSTCTVTITDNDHPLSPILGWYTCVDNIRSYTWQMEIRKDDSDLSTVWFYNIGGMSTSWAGDDIMYYGTADLEAGTITIPLGQESEYLYGGTTPVTLFSLDSSFTYIYDTGNYVMTIEDGGKTIKFEEDYGLYLYIVGTGSVGYCRQGVVATKN